MIQKILYTLLFSLLLTAAVFFCRYQIDITHKMRMTSHTSLNTLMYNHLFDLMRYKLQHGADPNEVGKNGEAIIVHAVREPTFLEAVKILLEHGANPNAQSIDGNNILIEAVVYDNSTALEAISGRVIVINQGDIDGIVQLAKSPNTKLIIQQKWGASSKSSGFQN